MVKDKQEISYLKRKRKQGWKEYMKKFYRGDEIDNDQIYIENEVDVNINILGQQ